MNQDQDFEQINLTRTNEEKVRRPLPRAPVNPSVTPSVHPRIATLQFELFSGPPVDLPPQPDFEAPLRKGKEPKRVVVRDDLSSHSSTDSFHSTFSHVDEVLVLEEDVVHPIPKSRDELLREKGIVKFAFDEIKASRALPKEPKKTSDQKRMEKQTQKLKEKMQKDIDQNIEQQKKFFQENHALAQGTANLLNGVGQQLESLGSESTLGRLARNVGNIALRTGELVTPEDALPPHGYPEQKVVGFRRQHQPTRPDDYVEVTGLETATPVPCEPFVTWNKNPAPHDREEITPSEMRLWDNRQRSRISWERYILLDRTVDMDEHQLAQGQATTSHVHHGLPLCIGSIVIGEGMDTQVAPCSFTVDGLVSAIRDHNSICKDVPTQIFHLPVLAQLYEWVPTTAGQLPQGRTPVLGGYDQWSYKLYYALKQINGGFYAGHTAVHLKHARIAVNGSVRLVMNYDILCFREEVKTELVEAVQPPVKPVRPSRPPRSNSNDAVRFGMEIDTEDDPLAEGDELGRGKPDQ